MPDKPRAQSLFECLPIELRMRIISFTHLGARGDYCEEHSVIFIDNGDLFRSGVAHMEPHGRKLPLGLFCVNRQMYKEACDVFYRESYFTLAPAYTKAWNFIHRLPSASIGLIRRLCLRATIADTESVIRNAFDNRPAKLWIRLIEFVRDNCDLSKLSISLDFSIAERWCSETVYHRRKEKTRRAVYEYYRFITSTLCMLTTLRDVNFELPWARNLAPWMRRETLGSRFHGDVKEPEPELLEDGTENVNGVPHWHRNDDRVQGSNYVPCNYTESAAIYIGGSGI